MNFFSRAPLNEQKQIGAGVKELSQPFPHLLEMKHFQDCHMLSPLSVPFHPQLEPNEASRAQI